MVREDADTVTSAGSVDEESDDESNNLRLVLPRTTEGGKPQRIRVCLEWSSSANGFVKCQTIATVEGDDDGDGGNSTMDGLAGSRDGVVETAEERFRKKRSNSSCENIEIDENGLISDGNGPKREETDGNKKYPDLYKPYNDNGVGVGRRERLDANPTTEPSGRVMSRTPHLTEEGGCLSDRGDADGADTSSRKLPATLAVDAASDERSEAQTAPGPSDDVPDHLFVTPSPQPPLHSQRRVVQAHRPSGIHAQEENRKNGQQPSLRPRQRNTASLAAAPPAPIVAGDGAPLLLTPLNVPTTQAVPAPLMPTLDTPSVHHQEQVGALLCEGPPRTPQTASVMSPPDVIRHTEAAECLDAGGDPTAERSMPLLAPDLAGMGPFETPQPAGQKAESEAEIEPEGDSKPHQKAEGVKPSPIVHRIGGPRRRSEHLVHAPAAKETQTEISNAGAESEHHAHDMHHEEGKQRHVVSLPTLKLSPSNKSDKSGGTHGSASTGLSTLAEIYTDKQRAYYVNSGNNRIDPATMPNPSCVPPERSGEQEQPACVDDDQAAELQMQPPSAPLPSPPHASQQEGVGTGACAAAPAPQHPHPQPHSERRTHDPRGYQDPYGQPFAQQPPPNVAPPNMAPWPPPPGAYPPQAHPPPPPHDPYHLYHHQHQASAFPPGGYHPHPYSGYHQYPYPSPMMYNYHAYAYQYGMYLEQQNHPPDMRGKIIDVNADDATETSSITLPVALPPSEEGPLYHHRQRRASIPAGVRSSQPEVIEEEGVEADGGVPPPDSPCDSAEATTALRPKSSPASTERTKNTASATDAGKETATVRSAPNPAPSTELDIMGQIVEMLTPACGAATTSRSVRNLGALQPYHSVMSMNQHIGIYRDRMTTNGGRRRQGGSVSSSRSDSGSLSPTSSVKSKKADRDYHNHSGVTVAGLSHLRGSFL